MRFRARLRLFFHDGLFRLAGIVFRAEKALRRLKPGGFDHLVAGVDNVAQAHGAVLLEGRDELLLEAQDLLIDGQQAGAVARAQAHSHGNVHVRVPCGRVEGHELTLDAQLHGLVVVFVQQVQHIAAQRLEEGFRIHPGHQLKPLVDGFFHDVCARGRVLQRIGLQRLRPAGNTRAPFRDLIGQAHGLQSIARAGHHRQRRDGRVALDTMHGPHPTGQQAVILDIPAHALVDHQLALVRQGQIVQHLAHGLRAQVLHIGHEVGHAQADDLVRHGHGTGREERRPVQGPLFVFDDLAAVALARPDGLDLFGHTVPVQIRVKPAFPDADTPRCTVPAVVLIVIVVEAAAHRGLRHLVLVIQGWQTGDQGRAVALFPQVRCRLHLPPGHEACAFHVLSIAADDHMLGRHRLDAHVTQRHGLMDIQIIEHPLRRGIPAHIDVVLLHIDGRIREQGNGFRLRKPAVLEHTLLLSLRAVGQTPAHTLVKTISQHVMHQPEDIPPEHHLIDVQRGIIGGLFLLRAFGVKTDNVVRATKHTHQPRLGPLHGLHDRAVNVCGQTALLTIFVHLVAIAQVLLFQPFARG